MSVLQRGGSFIQRRLSKLYSDTKQSYEDATVTSKEEENPDLASLHSDYRYQKDRLLAWGLDWSDSDSADFPYVEIDSSIDQAGFGDVVAYIMSTIQDLLVQSEKLQSSDESSFPAAKGYEPPGSFPSFNDGPEKPLSSQTWTPEQFARSRSLLAELTACIDHLFKLSETRRAKRKDAKETSVGKESFIRDLEMVRKRSSVASQWSERTLVNSMYGNRSSTSTLRQSMLTANFPPSPSNSSFEDKGKACANILGIVSSAVSLTSDPIDASNPPTYDAVVGEGTTRTLGSIDGKQLTAEQQQALRCKTGDIVPILIESTPIREWSLAIPPAEIISKVGEVHSNRISKAIDVPELIGYGTDPDKTQHMSVYRMSHRYAPNQSVSPALHALNTLFSQGTDSDTHMPPLEARFRLAFNLVVSVIQFQKSGLYHGAVNSSNVLLATFPPRKSADYRSPQLFSQLNFAPQTTDPSAGTDEPFSARIYRHPQEQELRTGAFSWTCDAYSLGLILLEIGLWTPVRRLWKSKYDADTFKSRIRAVYTPKLASRCGSAYMKAVQGLIDTPEIFKTSGSASTPMSYMASIVERLSRCCAMDVDGAPTEATVKFLQKAAIEEQRAIQTHPAVENNQPSSISESDIKPTSTDSQPRTKKGLRKWDTVDIPQADLDLWNTVLMPRLSKLLQNALGKSAESCSASLMMIGTSPEAAKTTICVQCTSVDPVRKMLKQNFRCKSGWGLVVLRGDVQRCNRRRKPAKKPKAQIAPAQEDAGQVDSCYQQRPCSGASIGAYKDLEHLPPVSFGGAVMVGGEMYGMTVHHMLDDPGQDDDDPTAVQRSAANGASATEDLSFMGGDSDIPDDPYSLELSDDEFLDLAESENENDGFWFSDMADLTDDDGVDNDADDDLESIGDTEGVDPFEGDEDMIVTQPAIDDVEDDFFPSLEDRDDDHLSSHTLGHVHASSGIRRITRAGLKHEVDWALIKINDDRLPEKNAFGRGDSSIITKIASLSDLPRTSVLCNGRTTGLQRGRISPALSLVKMHGRQSFSSSYCVDGGFGVPGDSGAWVVDPEKGTLCGHVLAWGNRSKMAFIAPMQVLKEDIERRIGGNVRLPDSEENAAAIIPSAVTDNRAISPEIPKRSPRRNTNNSRRPASKPLPLIPADASGQSFLIADRSRDNSRSRSSSPSLSQQHQQHQQQGPPPPRRRPSPLSSSSSTGSAGLRGLGPQVHTPTSLPLMMR